MNAQKCTDVQRHCVAEHHAVYGAKGYSLMELDRRDSLQLGEVREGLSIYGVAVVPIQELLAMEMTVVRKESNAVGRTYLNITDTYNLVLLPAPTPLKVDTKPSHALIPTPEVCT